MSPDALCNSIAGVTFQPRACQIVLSTSELKCPLYDVQGTVRPWTETFKYRQKYFPHRERIRSGIWTRSVESQTGGLMKNHNGFVRRFQVCVCVCVCERARVRVCVRARVRACVCIILYPILFRNTQYNILNTLKSKKVKALAVLYPVLPDFRKNTALWKVPLVLLVAATCRRRWVWNTGGMILTGENRSIRGGGGETCPSARSPTINHTQTDLGSNPGFGGDRPATNRLSQLPWITFKIFSPYRAVNTSSTQVSQTMRRLLLPHPSGPTRQ
jgi:hypothetical protein